MTTLFDHLSIEFYDDSQAPMHAMYGQASMQMSGPPVSHASGGAIGSCNAPSTVKNGMNQRVADGAGTRPTNASSHFDSIENAAENASVNVNVDSVNGDVSPSNTQTNILGSASSHLEERLPSIEGLLDGSKQNDPDNDLLDMFIKGMEDGVV